MSVMHDCHTGTDSLYNPLLLGAVHDVENLAAGAIDIAPGVWLKIAARLWEWVWGGEF